MILTLYICTTYYHTNFQPLTHFYEKSSFANTCAGDIDLLRMQQQKNSHGHLQSILCGV